MPITVDGTVYTEADVRALVARISVLEGHRNQWRNIALELDSALGSLDAYADPTELVRAKVDAALARLKEAPT